ncbi:MAG TPA: hypothetical protein VFV58_11665 [Blastocatellia bacterium]|jgi:hypothetical protein|nr:hypothetical protein [Blastocatellia bacterium]
MGLYGLVDDFPILALFVFTLLVVLLSYEGGFRAGRWRNRRSEREQEVAVRSMVGTMLGLLTFILAFTFWLAATHFDAARQAILNEANAIRTAYLRADLLPEPHRTEIRDLLREYVDVRLEGVRSGNIEQAIARSEELHRQLWSQAVAAREKDSSPIFIGYFIQSLNDVIALHTRRLTVGREFRIPTTIWIVLFVIMPLAAASVGCHGGLTGANRPLAAVGFVLIITVVMTLIGDLDNTRKGSLRVSQQTLADVRNTMNTTNH